MCRPRRRMGGNRVKTPIILNLNTRWWWVFTFLRGERETVPSEQDGGKFHSLLPRQMETLNSIYILFKGPCGSIKRTYRLGLSNGPNPQCIFSKFCLTKTQIHTSKAALIFLRVESMGQGRGGVLKAIKSLPIGIERFSFPRNVIISEGPSCGCSRV